MKAKPYRKDDKGYEECAPEEATDILLHLPGPISRRMIPVQIKGARAGTGNWTWNGSMDSPTLRPSIINDFRPSDPLVDHIWITDGKVIFLPDSTHEFAGQTLDLLEVE